ncbi:MAG: hypothetical protein ACOC22_01180 [bacterium]
MKSKFKEELTQLLNKHSMENGSNTPDFILAQYLLNCLAVFNSAVTKREEWYDRNISGTKNEPNIFGLTPEDEEKLIALFEQPEPCSNCKETVEVCACMRNICNDRGEPVSNVTFSVCDECYNKGSRERKIKKLENSFNEVEHKLKTEHYFIRNDSENRNRFQSYTQMILNHMKFDEEYGTYYRIISDETNNPPSVIDNKQIVGTIHYFSGEDIRLSKTIQLNLYTPYGKNYDYSSW